MKLIKHVGSRKAQNGRGQMVAMGLYRCPGCGGEIELPVSVGRNYKSCGCQEKIIRTATIYRPKPAERTCLMCGEKFASRGPHNRRCGVCEHAIQIGVESAYYMPPIHRQNEKRVVACCVES